jgi:hypothetical protein
MVRVTRWTWAVVMAAMLLGVWAGIAGAQADPAAALVGTWEGELTFRTNTADANRTLVIKSVIQQDGKWVGEGLYGTTGKNLSKVAIDVDVKGRRPSLQFTSGEGSVIKLDLLDPKSLVGTLTLSGSRKGGADRPLKLEKKE